MTTLRPNATGLLGATVLGAIIMSPALTIYGNWGPMALDVGPVGPLIFLVGLIGLLPTAISFALVAREMLSAGSAYTWLWRALSPTTGIWIGLMLIFYYIIGVNLQPYLFGIYFSELLKYFNIISAPAAGGYDYLPYAVGVVICTVIGAVLIYRGIRVSLRGTLVIIAIEIAVLTILCLTILVDRASSGNLSFEPFNPGAFTAPEGVQPINAFFLAMILAVLSFTGFDAIATISEETKTPRRIIPLATILATVLVAVFWMFASWAVSIAVPMSQVGDLVSSGFTPIVPIANQYLGAFDLLVILTAMSAAVGVFVAVGTAATRVLYAVARESILPAALGRLHPRFRAPWNAAHVVFAISIVATLVWPIWLTNSTTGAADPLTSFVWWANGITWFALLVYIFVNIANMVFFWRYRRSAFNWFLNLVLPLFGIGFDIAVMYQGFFVADMSNPDFRIGPAVVYLCIAGTVAGGVYALWLRTRRAHLLQREALVFSELPADAE